MFWTTINSVPPDFNFFLPFHTKYSVYIYMQFIFICLKEKYASIEAIDIFSDGGWNNFTIQTEISFSNLHSSEIEHIIKLSWNFFPASHGKGVVDGIGGTIKRTVWRHIKTEIHHITFAPLKDIHTCKRVLPKHSFQRMKWKRIMHFLMFDGKGCFFFFMCG